MFDMCGRKFSVKTCVMVAKQMVSGWLGVVVLVKPERCRYRSPPRPPLPPHPPGGPTQLTRIQTVHEKNLVYRDIKPDNFLIGRPGTKGANVVHVVDFGMAKQYRDPKTWVLGRGRGGGGVSHECFRGRGRLTIALLQLVQKATYSIQGEEEFEWNS